MALLPSLEMRIAPVNPSLHSLVITYSQLPPVLPVELLAALLATLLATLDATELDGELEAGVDEVPPPTMP